MRRAGSGKKDPEQSTSLAQLGASTCDESTLQDMKKHHQHCAPQTWQHVKKACSQEKQWQISLDDENDIDAPDAYQCTLKMINPDVNPLTSGLIIFNLH